MLPPPRHDFVQNLTNAARENPVSAALIGMGVLWMFMGGSRSSLFGGASKAAGVAYGAARSGAGFVGDAAQYAGNAAYDAAGGVGSAARYVAGGVGHAMHQVADRVGSTLSSGANMVSDGLSSAASHTGETARNTGSAAGDAASSTGSQASSAFSSAYEGVGSAASSAYQGVGSAAGRARELLSETGASLSAAARTAQERGYSLGRTLQSDLAEIFEKQPLLLGAVGIAIGAALAAAVPTTDAENRLMGDTSESLKEQAKQMASQQMARAKTMGSEFVQEVSRQASAEGLTPSAAGDAVSAVKDKLSNVAEAAREGLKTKMEQTGAASNNSPRRSL